MPTIKFFTRVRGKELKKLVNIQCRFKAGRGVDFQAMTGLQAFPEHWNAQKESVRNIAEATYKDQVNNSLSKLKAHILSEFAKNRVELSKEWLNRIIDEFHYPEKYQVKQATLFDFIEEFIENAPTRLNPKTNMPVCYKQVREYERTFFYLKDFAEVKMRKLNFDDINLDFYHDFITYLQSEKTFKKKNGVKVTEEGLAQNTIGKKIQTLKIFLNAASDKGINVNTQYKSHRFKAITEESESIFLPEQEIQMLYDLDLKDNERLEKARDLFIIGCWTGLRYGDWNKVQLENIEDGFLSLSPSKTNDPVVIPLHDMVQAIMDKYEGVLPSVISNQKFNDYLKEVAKMAGLNSTEQKSITKGGVRRTVTYEKWELVTTHTGRRSFATNLYKAGLPSLTIMKITGHRTEVSFLKYIKVTPREHAMKLKEFWQNRPVMNVLSA